MLIDAHTHVFAEHIVDRAMEALTARYGAAPVARPTTDGLLRHMDENAVDRAIVLSVATKPSQVRSINAWLTGLNEPRLIPFGSLHPHLEDVEEEIARLVDAGVRGVKLQPHFQDYRLDDPRLLKMLERIGDRLLVLMQGGQEIVRIDDVQPTPQRLLALHRRVPEVRFILAHLGAYRQWDEMEEHLVGEEVVLDASYVFGICPDEQIERIIRNHGADGIVWGSDFPWHPASLGLEGMRRLSLSKAEREAILGGNIARMLGAA